MGGISIYTLECRFSINKSRRLNIDKIELEAYRDDDILCSLISRDRLDHDQYKKICDSTNLMIRCIGFGKRDDAEEFATHIFYFLNYFGFKYDVFISRFVNKGSMSEELKKLLPNTDDERAVIVYEDATKPSFFSAQIEGYKKYNDDEIFFLSSINRIKMDDIENFRVIESALELLNSTIVESNQKVRLLNLIMSLELLTNLLTEKEKIKSNRQLELIGIATDAIKEAALNDQEIHSLVSALGNFRNKSMTDQLVYLLNKVDQPTKILDYSLSKFIAICYRIRSAIVHGNRLDKNKVLQKHELSTINFHLSRITINLIDQVVLKENDKK